MNLYIQKLLQPKTLVLLLLIGGLTLIGSAFFIEHVLEAKPCQMCWWQRYIHWGITAIALIGFFSKRYICTLKAITVVSFSGFYVAIWQTLVQQKILPPPGCGDEGNILPLNSVDLLNSLNTASYTLPSCDKIDFTVFGFSLANWNIIVMFGFMVVALASICYNRNK